jgi:hypothetical protein
MKFPAYPCNLKRGRTFQGSEGEDFMAQEYVKIFSGRSRGTHILKTGIKTWCGLNIFNFNAFEVCNSSKKPCEKCVSAMNEAKRNEVANGEV